MEILKNVIDLTKITPDTTIAGKNVYINLLGTSSLKPYKHRLSYIKSTGTQWIDTNIVPTMNMIVEIKCQAEAQSVCPVGAGSSGTNTRFQIIASTQYYSARVGAKTQTNQTAAYDDLVVAKVNSATNTLEINGVSSTLAGTGTSSLTTNPLALHRRRMDDGDATVAAFVGTIYYCTIVDNGVTVGEFIPVVDNDDVVCYYDNITEAFSYNQGTGDFIAGGVIG